MPGVLSLRFLCFLCFSHSTSCWLVRYFFLDAHLILLTGPGCRLYTHYIYDYEYNYEDKRSIRKPTYRIHTLQLSNETLVHTYIRTTNTHHSNHDEDELDLPRPRRTGCALHRRSGVNGLWSVFLPHISLFPSPPPSHLSR